MAADLILTASRIITMETDAPTAQAVAIDTGQGTIVAVGSLAGCQAAAPGVAPTDLGDSVLMPGFIDPHSHPILAGVMTQSPAFWIAPYLGYPTYADVQAFWRKLDAKTPPGQALVFTGLDRILQGAPELTKTDLRHALPVAPGGGAGQLRARGLLQLSRDHAQRLGGRKAAGRSRGISLRPQSRRHVERACLRDRGGTGGH